MESEREFEDMDPDKVVALSIGTSPGTVLTEFGEGLKGTRKGEPESLAARRAIRRMCALLVPESDMRTEIYVNLNHPTL